MQPTDKEIQEIKSGLEQTHKREFTPDEASTAAWDMQSFAGIIYDAGLREWERQKKLKEMPNGYHLEGSGTCLVCGRTAANESSWFDKYGLKCVVCQNAINKKVVPALIAKDKNSWYTRYELEIYFNLKGKYLNQCVKEGLLKDRKIQGAGKSVHMQLFLLSDNKKVLPPKRLLKSRFVKELRNGEEYFTTEYWYEFVDDKLAKKIVNYKIVDLFPFTFSQPFETGRFYTKSINPLFVPTM